MTTFFRCLWAETLKSKRTLALALTLTAPAVIVAMVFVFYLQRFNYFKPISGENPWDRYSQMILVYWTLLMLPLFITLETALLGHLEHSHGNWKLLYTLPIPRWSVYAAKQATIMIWILVSNLVLLGLMALSGRVLQWLDPRYGLDAPIPWGTILRYTALTYLASWFMMSFHLWVSLRWNSFVLACGIGIAAAILSAFTFGEDIGNYFPWSLPAALSVQMTTNNPLWISLAIGCLGGVIMALLGGWDTARQDVV